MPTVRVSDAGMTLGASTMLKRLNAAAGCPGHVGVFVLRVPARVVTARSRAKRGVRAATPREAWSCSTGGALTVGTLMTLVAMKLSTPLEIILLGFGLFFDRGVDIFHPPLGVVRSPTVGSRHYSARLGAMSMCHIWLLLPACGHSAGGYWGTMPLCLR